MTSVHLSICPSVPHDAYQVSMLHDHLTPYSLPYTAQPTHVYIGIIYLTFLTTRTPDIPHLYIPPVACSLVCLASRNILWSCQRVGLCPGSPVSVCRENNSLSTNHSFPVKRSVSSDFLLPIRSAGNILLLSGSTVKPCLFSKIHEIPHSFTFRGKRHAWSEFEVYFYTTSPWWPWSSSPHHAYNEAVKIQPWHCSLQGICHLSWGRGGE
jgi:hypothetical protein